MKKALSLIIVAVLAFSALASLASCGGSSEGIVGEWKTEIKFADYIGEEAKTSLSFLGENALDAFKDKVFSFSFNFKDNGKVAAVIDKDSYLALMKDLVGGWVSEEELAKGIDEMNGTEADYKFENGELDINGTVFKAEISGNKLILKELVSTNEGEESVDNLPLPLEFTRK